MTANQRLRDARVRRGFDTALAAANAFGWNFNTYAAHENGNRGITIKTAEKYARALRVSPAWLLTGDKQNALTTVPVSGIVIEEGLVVPPKKPDKMTAPAPRDADISTRALTIKGNAVGPSASDNWHFYYAEPLSPPTLTAHGKLCLVETTRGQRLVRRVYPGRRPGAYDLHSLTGSVSLDVDLRSAAIILWIRPT